MDWYFYIVFIIKTAYKKIGALIHSMKIFPFKVALYLYKSTKQTGPSICYLNMSKKA